MAYDEMSVEERWLPYLGDRVELQVGGLPVHGQASRFDPSLVEVEQSVGVQPGQLLEARWQVGAERHDAQATIEDVTAAGFTVRLPAARLVRESRRRHERHSLSLGMHLSPVRHGSLDGSAHRGRTLDLSDSGARALIDADAPIGVGELIEVQVEVGGTTHLLLADVVWEKEHGAGERLAGLRFHTPIQARTWAALAAA